MRNKSTCITLSANNISPLIGIFNAIWNDLNTLKKYLPLNRCWFVAFCSACWAYKWVGYIRIYVIWTVRYFFNTLRNWESSHILWTKIISFALWTNKFTWFLNIVIAILNMQNTLLKRIPWNAGRNISRYCTLNTCIISILRRVTFTVRYSLNTMRSWIICNQCWNIFSCQTLSADKYSWIYRVLRIEWAILNNRCIYALRILKVRNV